MRLRLGVSMVALAAALSLPALATGLQQSGGEEQGQTSPPASAGSEKEAAGGLPHLSGPESIAPGTTSPEHSYFFPSFQIFGLADSHSTVTSGPQRFESIETAVLGLAGESVGKHSRAIADYQGGVLLYNRHSGLDATEHQVGLNWSYQGRRWGWALDERANYLPESAFGYPGFGWRGALGTDLGGATGSNLGSLNPNFDPNQVLFSSRGSRIVNGTAAEVQYATSPRSSLSVSGAFGMLTFRTPGSIDSTNELITVAYNHSLSRRDFASVSYGMNVFQFRPVGESFKVHSIDFSYGHRIRGKLAIGVGGGPQFAVFGSPIFGSSVTATWVGHGSVAWNTPSNAFTLSAMRYTTNGGGVLAGTIADQFQINWSPRLSRKWSGSLGPGYARNTSLPQTILAGQSATYDSVYAQASLSRAFGHNTNMFVNYTFQGQSSRTACLAGNCNASLSRHVLSLGFAWHRRQIVLE